MKIGKLLKTILAPKKCYSCKKEGHFFCDACNFRLSSFEDICYVCKEASKNFEIHDFCKNDSSYYDKIIVKYHYTGYFIPKMIKDGKFYHKKDILYDFSDELFGLYQKYLPNEKDIIVIPVPLHFLKKMKRGYNQSEVLSHSFISSPLLGYHNTLILRKKYTRQQSKLSKNKRLENIKNAFVINKKYIDIIDKKTFIIIDDVVSTGGTINSIAKLLKEHGAEKVIAICLASK